MSKKLFIGGISWNTTEDGLRQAFSQFGDIEEVRIVMDRETGRSRGFGFLVFSNDNDATKAITAMDGQTLDGRVIKVNEAIEKPDRGGGGRFRQ